MVCPVAGASTRIRSATPLRSICLILPRTRMSLMPGMALATTSRIPEDMQAFGHPPHSVVGQVLEEGVVRGDRPGLDGAPGTAVRVLVVILEVVGTGRGQDRPGVVRGARCAPNADGTPGRPSSSTTRTERPSMGRHPGQGGDHGRLAHAAFAGHDQDVALAAKGADVHDVRSVVPASAPWPTAGPPGAPIRPGVTVRTARRRGYDREILVRPLVSGNARRVRSLAGGRPLGAKGDGGTMAQAVDTWQIKASCRGPQAEIFFPPSHAERKDEKLQREARAKSICRTCAVRSIAWTTPFASASPTASGAA